MKRGVATLWVLGFLFVVGATAVSAQETMDVGPRLEAQARAIDEVKTNLDYVWVIATTALVFFMQSGFMALEAGMARSKNSINVAIKNLTDFVLGVLGFWLVGFGVMFGKSKWGLFGTTDFLISGTDSWEAAFFMFQGVFVGTAATIDSGAICERSKLKQYILLSLLMSVITYPLFGHWAWGSLLRGAESTGWLEALGFKDFAGSSVVHSMGGWMALAGIIVVGPRLGKFEIDPVTGKRGAPHKFQPGDMRFVFLGTFILFFGWFGFNCGSTLAATPKIAVIALNTTIAACTGCVASSLLSWVTHPEKKIEGEMIANGVLGGLVAITAGCAFVDAAGAAIIGLVAGAVVFYGSRFLEYALKLDDVVGAVPVHGFCGAWGTFAVGLFITRESLGSLTRTHQIAVQALGVGVCLAWGLGMGLLLYFLVDRLAGGIRVSEEDEIIGLNVAEHGATSSLLDLARSMDDLTTTGNFEDHPGVEVDRGTEVGDLAIIFNKMVARIRQALEESRTQQLVAERMLEESRRQQALAQEKDRELDRTRSSAEQSRRDYITRAQGMIEAVIEKTEGIRERMENTTVITETMCRSFEELTGTLDRMLESLSVIYGNMKDVDTVSKAASETAGRTRAEIGELKQVTDEINAMLHFIDEIAARTHVLSINTAIEASRASADGGGFTVISKEVRNLSAQTSDTAAGIGRNVKGIQDRIATVVSAMDKIGDVVERIGTMLAAVLSLVAENERHTHELEERSKGTVRAVEGVKDDVGRVVGEVREVTSLGQRVRDGLKDIS